MAPTRPSWRALVPYCIASVRPACSRHRWNERAGASRRGSVTRVVGKGPNETCPDRHFDLSPVAAVGLAGPGSTRRLATFRRPRRADVPATAGASPVAGGPPARPVPAGRSGAAKSPPLARRSRPARRSACPAPRRRPGARSAPAPRPGPARPCSVPAAETRGDRRRSPSRFARERPWEIVHPTGRCHQGLLRRSTSSMRGQLALPQVGGRDLGPQEVRKTFKRPLSLAANQPRDRSSDPLFDHVHDRQ